MPKKTLTATLSVSSIRQLQKDLKRYQEYLTNKAAQFAKRLSEAGVDITQVQIADLDAIFTGELIQSLHSEYKGSTQYGAIFAVVTDSKHAAFVCFGTGQRGKDTPYPYPLPEGVSWDYNVGKTIRQNAVTGRYYWFYPGQDGLWHYTEGMPARPFMYLTSMELIKEVPKIAKEVFGGK